MQEPGYETVIHGQSFSIRMTPKRKWLSNDKITTENQQGRAGFVSLGQDWRESGVEFCISVLEGKTGGLKAESGVEFGISVRACCDSNTPTACINAKMRRLSTFST